MEIILKNAVIIDKNSEWNGKKVSIHIRNGKIAEIGDFPTSENAKIIDLDGAYVSPGWFDIGTRLTEPGYESIDDIDSISNSAVKGGFTGLAVFPNTDPVVDNKSIINSIKNKCAGLPVDFYPVAALSKGCKGTEMSEMIDLHTHGAIAFSDGKKSMAHAGLLSRNLRYASMIPAPVINHPEDMSISENGIINEGKISVQLGLKGRPELAETIMLIRDIALCEYNNSHLISHMISTAESVKRLRTARKGGINIDATVSYHNLVANEDVLKDFDSMHKVLPPLRTKTDINALINGLKDGTIDAIVSNHYPVDVEDKKKAFYDTEFGSLGLESIFGVLNYHLHSKLDLDLLIEKISNGPRKILGLPLVEIKKGTFANLTLFNADDLSVFSENDIRSKSTNSAFINSKIKGKAIGTINKGILTIN
jgi:dihydroorotase